MAPLRLHYPSSSTSSTGDIVLRESLASLTNPQPTIQQQYHVAQGGIGFVFTPLSTAGAAFINRVLPVDIEALPEANTTAPARSGFTALSNFLLTTLVGNKNSCTLTDPDGASYSVRYVRGLETFQERPRKGRWSGQLLFRVEP